MSPGGQDRPPKQRMISFTPALPDGTDCPWIRDRRTRWWLVIPADFVAVALVALFSAASTHTMGQVVTALWHLEMALPEGLIVVGLVWVTWTALRYLTAAFDDGAAVASWAVMTGTFLLVFLGGWRWLYGYVRAHDSLIPKPLERRLAEQEQDGR